MTARRVALGAALLAAAALAAGPAEAGAHRHRRAGRASPDTERVLAGMAERDRLVLWPALARPRPPAGFLPPATRERVAAPPFTGWGYGGTIPGAWPGF